MEKLAFGDGDLFEAISLQLLRLTGHRVQVDQLKSVQLDPIHQANIRVVDEQGNLLQQGRDWSELQRKLGDAAQTAIQQAPKQSWGETELTEWSFGQLDKQKTVKHAGGIEVEAYPALIDKGENVELTLLSQPLDAQRQSHRGVARLVLISLQTQVKDIRKSLPNLAQAILQAGKKYNERFLQEQIIMAAALSLIDQDNLPSSESEFSQTRDSVRADLHEQAKTITAFVIELHQRVHRISKALNGKVSLETVPVLNDIRAQLDRLIDKTYLTETPPQWLAHLPRYLKAIEVRLEKYQRALRQQVLWSDELVKWQQQYEAAVAKARDTGEVGSELIDFKWWIEEYRVSLFAQELGTEFKISEKRLKQRFTEVSG
jgi:ATP-dependent helicase HrpA